MKDSGNRVILLIYLPIYLDLTIFVINPSIHPSITVLVVEVVESLLKHLIDGKLKVKALIMKVIFVGMLEPDLKLHVINHQNGVHVKRKEGSFSERMESREEVGGQRKRRGEEWRGRAV